MFITVNRWLAWFIIGVIFLLLVNGLTMFRFFIAFVWEVLLHCLLILLIFWISLRRFKLLTFTMIQDTFIQRHYHFLLLTRCMVLITHLLILIFDWHTIFQLFCSIFLFRFFIFKCFCFSLRRKYRGSLFSLPLGMQNIFVYDSVVFRSFELLFFHSWTFAFSCAILLLL